MEMIQLPTLPFTVETLQNIYHCKTKLQTGEKKKQKKQIVEEMSDSEEEGEEEEEKKKTNIKDTIQYLSMYYFEIKGGQYYFYNVDKDEFEFKTDTDFRKEVLNKIGSKSFTSKVQKNAKIYDVVAKIGKPRIYKQSGKYYINEAGSFLHQTYKPFDDYSVDIKGKVKLMLQLIKMKRTNRLL